MSVPQHIALIMDGNRRWAKERGLPLIEGYRQGIRAFRNAIPAVRERGITVATFWGFSTENWRRPPGELSVLFSLFRRAIDESREWLCRSNARLKISGRLHDFPEDLARAAGRLIEATAGNTGLMVNLCLSYGGREEIQHLARGVAREALRDPGVAERIDEALVSSHLWTAGLPDVDLLIRTGGERRLSGFLPWQAAYAELYFTETLWPDFDARELDRALEDFVTRKRNFGQ